VEKAQGHISAGNQPDGASLIFNREHDPPRAGKNERESQAGDSRFYF
jgi:hypothetical protein